MRCARHVAHVKEMTNAYKNLIGKPKRRRRFGGPVRRWEGNIQVDQIYIAYGDA
jgi:hypothetical protein